MTTETTVDSTNPAFTIDRLLESYGTFREDPLIARPCAWHAIVLLTLIAGSGGTTVDDLRIVIDEICRRLGREFTEETNGRTLECMLWAMARNTIIEHTRRDSRSPPGITVTEYGMMHLEYLRTVLTTKR